ncbi:hypothetical protein H5410_003433 [Solanum commersonii]|uniref:Uncharacterized protein n=1 Tax=Solanum commersonii TaxID=4109 RepID=A0A9J6B542_SOLCO|nr:hypothetical protein H5410_003433 [Solanum commersonii]
MELKATWGTLVNRRVVRRARPSSPNNPTCLLSTKLLKLNPATPKKKIKTCTYQIKLKANIPMPPGYSHFS